MTNIFKMSLCVLLLTSASLSPARADNACPGFEAKTASGGCVNPMLSASLRQRSILLSQQRISEQAFPILPSQDRVYPRPGEFNRFELIGVTAEERCGRQASSARVLVFCRVIRIADVALSPSRHPRVANE